MPKDLFSVERDFDHSSPPRVGVLVANLGTPEAPTAKALRPYLRQFLWDPRVVELSRPLWWLILNGPVLTFRPKRSAALYRNIWTPEGSPLLVTSRRLTASVEANLRERYGDSVRCALGMTYGEPSMASALAELRDAGCRRIVVLPLYPHYSGSTVGSVFDAVTRELQRWRWVPELRTINQYHDDPRFIAALAGRVRRFWDENGEPEILVTTYHGIPQRYFDNGDPYHCQCHKTTRLLVEALGWSPDRVVVSFQSLFGKEEWLKPYTDATLEALATAGTRSVDMLCPGFATDCLETIDEIGRESRHVFLEAGGTQYRYIPCLNDQEDHVEVLTELVDRNLRGWLEQDHEHQQLIEEAARTAARARELAQRGSAGCPFHAARPQ